MKNLFSILLFITCTLRLSAQNIEKPGAARYEYAYVYTQVYGKFNLKIHYENETDTILTVTDRFDLQNGKNGLIDFFDILTNAFHYLENKGYEQVASNQTFYKFGEQEVPYFIFRRNKIIK